MAIALDVRRQPDSMLPATDLLTDVLPAGNLAASGRPVDTLRAELRQIADVRNAGSVAFVWLQVVGGFVLAIRLDHPAAWVALFLLQSRAFALLAILGHEAAHRLLFTRKSTNDRVGRWLLSYPAFVPYDLYRRSHMAHHRDEMGPEEPDKNLYSGYPITTASMRRKLVRDGRGSSGWKNLKGLVRAFTSEIGRPVAMRILAAQIVLLALATAVGRPWLWPVFWLLPWMTGWRVLNRLRAIAEHGGMGRSNDKRLTTHHVRQGLIPRFWMVPFNTGWHLAHHVDSGIPWRNLPKLHAELEQVGWATPELTYPTYRALWRALSSREAAAAPARQRHP